MSLRSGTQKYGSSDDVWVTEGGYTRNLFLEEKLENELLQVNNEIKNLGGFNPVTYPIPSWWKRVALDVNQDPSSPGQGYGHGITTHQQAIDYLKLSKKYYQAKINQLDYQCNNYPRDTIFCQHASGFQAVVGKIGGLIPIIQKRVTSFEFPEILPQVFAEEDPSVNSGLNGNEQESQVINYPQSANVRIVISNISMFSTSIPINDISQLQILSNESNEWRYTLIGSSTNQPLMTLSGLINKINNMIASAVTPQPQPQPPVTQPPVTQPPVTQPPVITTVHIPPPEMPVEVPMVTVTPTEPGEVNWIPEPFFSFINNVFRK